MRPLASRNGGGRVRSLISSNTLSPVLAVCILFVSLQSFRLTSIEDNTTNSDKANFVKIKDEIKKDNINIDRNTDLYSVNANSINDEVKYNDNINKNTDITTPANNFTASEFRAGRIENYVNLPVLYHPDRDKIVLDLMEQPVEEPAETLLHKAPTPPSNNVIMGLASYPQFMSGWQHLVGSLRTNGYEGHIILGVHPQIPNNERDYLDKMGVTYYAVETANCNAVAMAKGPETNNHVRAKCSRGLENLKLEWGRFEMARRWLQACDTCTGWSMVIDTRDIFFQSDPFASLGNADDALQDLMFVEEVALHTNTLPDPSRAFSLTHWFFKILARGCYGGKLVASKKIADRPMLCSGTVIGNRNGMHRFLTVLVNEFHNNNKKGIDECRSPNIADQPTMNYLYYKGDFGFPRQTKTLPWGTGPVFTIGKPCSTDLYNNVTKKRENVHSLKDMVVFDGNGLILNPHEKEGSSTYIAPTIHQWDRCHDWIEPWFTTHKKLYSPDNETGVKWVKHGKLDSNY